MLVRAKFCDEFVEGVIRELGPVVGDYHLWDAKTSQNVSFIEASEVLGSDFGQGFGFYAIGEVVDRYY